MVERLFALRLGGGSSRKPLVHNGGHSRPSNYCCQGPWSALVGGRPRVTGPDVILVHRLLKNSVAAGAYLLLTEPALERVGLDPVARGMRRHLVSYPYLGEVPCFVADLVSLAPPAAAGAAVRAA